MLTDMDLYIIKEHIADAKEQINKMLEAEQYFNAFANMKFIIESELVDQDVVRDDTTAEEDMDDDTPDDAEDTGGDENTPIDTGGDGDTGGGNEDTPDTGGDTTGNGEEGDAGEEDMTDDTADGEADENTEPDEDTPIDTEDGEEEDTEGEESLDKIENDLFADMTPEQRNIQDKELKNNFILLNDALSDILERLAKVYKTNDNIKIVDFANRTLLKLKDMISYYLTNTYITKTYQENMLFYQHCLIIMSDTEKLIAEITDSEDD